MGFAYARVMTRVRASVGLRAFAKARPGSRPHSCSAPGARRDKPPTCRPNSTASEPDGASRKRLLQSLPLSSPPSITCSRAEPCIGTSAPTTSIVVARSNKRTAYSNDWLTWATSCNSPHVPISVATADRSKEVSLYGTPAESLSSRIPIVERITVPPCIGKGLGRDLTMHESYDEDASVFPAQR